MGYKNSGSSILGKLVSVPLILLGLNIKDFSESLHNLSSSPLNTQFPSLIFIKFRHWSHIYNLRQHSIYPLIPITFHLKLFSTHSTIHATGTPGRMYSRIQV